MSNPRTVRGSGARGMQGGRGSRNPGKTLKRLLAYIWKDYKLHCLVVAVSIAVSSLTGVIGNLFLRSLIDDYILPFGSISRIGSDIILIDIQGEYQRGKRSKRSGF